MDGKSLHLKAEKARENEEFLEALKLADEALLQYQKEGDIVGFCEVLCARFITFQLLYEETNDRNYLIIGKFSAKSAVKIARKSEKPEALALPLFHLANAYLLLQKYDKALEKYQEALDALPQSPYNRPSVLANIKIFKGTAAFKNGDKEAIKEVEEAVKELEMADEEKYAKDVWVSGGYLKLAEALSSRDYLEKARSIIEANPELKIRRKQLARIEAKLQ